jgi:hypothetical protein
MSNVFAESRKAQNNNVTVVIVVLYLQYMVFTLCHRKYTISSYTYILVGFTGKKI